MRYYFNSTNRCTAIITEDPTLNNLPKEAANAAYVVDGDTGRDPANAFLDSSGALRNKNAVTVTNLSSAYKRIRFQVAATWYPAYLVVTGSNFSTNLVASTPNQIFEIAVNYADYYYTVACDPLYGSGSNNRVYSCECYSCDCGGG